jgi:phosphoglucomutase
MLHIRASQGVEVKLVPTKPFDGQKTGTSGLRKKTEVFMQEHYLANWCDPACDATSAPTLRQAKA